MSALEYIGVLGGLYFAGIYFDSKAKAAKQSQTGMPEGGEDLGTQGLNRFNHSDLIHKHARGFRNRFEDIGYVRDDLAQVSTYFNEMNPNELQSQLGWDLLDIKPKREDYRFGIGTEVLDPLFGDDNFTLPVVPIVQPPYYQINSSRKIGK